MGQSQGLTSKDKDFQTARYWAVVCFAGNFGLEMRDEKSVIAPIPRKMSGG